MSENCAPEIQLAKLQGSDKEIAWAKKLRADAFERIAQLVENWQNRTLRLKITPERIEELETRKCETLDRYEAIKRKLAAQTSARFWIDLDPVVHDWADLDQVEKHLQGCDT